MAKVKVLHLITHLGIGGAQDNTLLTVKGHSRQRYQVHLAAGQDYTDWIERGREYADHLDIIPDLRRSAHPWADVKTLNRLTDYLKKHNFDIVHTHSAKAGTLGRMAARRANVPIVVHTFHSFGWQIARSAQHHLWQRATSSVKEWSYYLIERYAASLSDALVTVSELNRQEAVELNLASPDKLTTIYSGIDLRRFQVNGERRDKCRRLGLDPDRPIIGTIGRLSTQKAPLDFVIAAKAVLQKRPDAQFIMVGDGPLASAVDHAIGDDERIKVFGYRDDVPDILSVFDLFALSSLWEGLGRALTEAMIVGVPVAATAVDGVPELVTHGETGLLSPAGEPDQLAENIQWLLDHSKEAEEMSRSAKKRVVPAFSAERMVENIEALYERLLLEKGLSEQQHTRRPRQSALALK